MGVTPGQMMAEYQPVPARGGSLEKKFTFFYKPYNYIINTQKFMKFEEEPTPEVLEEQRVLAPCFANLKLTPWTDNRPESLVVHDRAVGEHLRDFEDCQSWRDVHNFMFSSDQRTYLFVLNQLMRMLGVKRKKKKNKQLKSKAADFMAMSFARQVLKQKNQLQEGVESPNPSSSHITTQK